MSQKTTKEIVTEAVGTGELLTVTYQGGRAPGYKRKTMIRSVDEDAVKVREFPGDIPRTTCCLGQTLSMTITRRRGCRRTLAKQLPLSLSHIFQVGLLQLSLRISQPLE